MKKEKLNIILPEKKGIRPGDWVKITQGILLGNVYEVDIIDSVNVHLKNATFTFAIDIIAVKKLNRHAILKPSRGKKKGFYFNLVGDNFEIVGTSEVYTTKAKARQTLKKYFPSFRIQTPDK